MHQSCDQPIADQCTTQSRLRFLCASRLLLFTLAAIFCSTAFGQETATILGTVTDPTGAAVPGAKITITCSPIRVSKARSSPAHRSLRSTPTGAIRCNWQRWFQALPATFRISMRQRPFRAVKRSALTAKEQNTTCGESMAAKPMTAAAGAASL